MALTQQELAIQMIQQLRRLDPSVSAEVGTPERKIIDTVAQALTDSQIDLTALQADLNLDSKFGEALDRFLTIFGFARQKATYATGFVTLSRIMPSTSDILIPANTQLQTALSDPTDPHNQIQFYTTAAATLRSGDLEVIAPIRARVAGASGNVAAGAITQIVGPSLFGVTDVTNEVATRNGVNRESDDELKVRFRNTVFRNLAGTRDQYLALAVATQYSLKANVVGPQSIWREYMQVPPVDDASAYDVDDNLSTEAGNGNAGEYTTALTTLPYAKAIWTTLPPFVFTSQGGQDQFFYRPDVDFRLNTAPVATNRGDAYRLWTAYGALGGASDPLNTANRPNVTFTNIYTGVDPDIQAVRPNDVLLVEFQYLSDASRNNISAGITNAVDVYVDGGNDQFATTVLTAPTNTTVFVDNLNSKFHYENYRRFGEPTKRPLLGNYLMPLMWQPVTTVPDQIIVGDNTYVLGTHYWMVEDVSELGGTHRARSGIEWSQINKGNSSGTRRLITEWTGGIATAIEVSNYQFDRNILDLQASIEGERQVTTDVLAHKARRRYFKFDITVMFAAGAVQSEVMADIRDSVDTFLKSQYFGAIIQLSDILQVVHSVSGVDNVRWSSDLPNNEDLARVYECDINGRPFLGVSADRVIKGGSVSVPEKQQLYITGQPVNRLSGLDSTFKLTYTGGGVSTAVTLYPTLDLVALDTAIESIMGSGTVTVVEDTRSVARDPIRSFTVTWTNSLSTPAQLIPISYLKGGPAVIYNDFILRDNELVALPTGSFDPVVGGVTTWYGANNQPIPADTIPGFIIRTRAQSTWIR